MDKYQGQQNDYVLLSLVRTNHFGHLRDVRRLGESHEGPGQGEQWVWGGCAGCLGWSLHLDG